MYTFKTSLESNGTNATCPVSLLWSQQTIDSQRPALYVCIVASIAHSIFWSQLIFCLAIRKRSMQWLYAYLTTDILLLFRFFFTFIVRTTLKECTSNSIWSSFLSYFEGILDDYLNTLEAYILLALNICRYIQIAYNRNVYTTYVRSIICAHLAIYLLPLISFIIQLSVGWAKFVYIPGGSYDVSYTNRYVQVINIIWGFALPIILNIFILYLNMHRIHLISQLSQGQHHVSAREKYHRSLVIQFLVFYTVWLSLWSPSLITYQFTDGINHATVITSLLNYIEITLDPIIIAALDVRFQKVWRNLWIHLRRRLWGNRMNQVGISPITINNHLRTMERAHNQTIHIPS